jgi:hypothetical protein
LREKGFSIKTILFERKLHGVHGVKNKIGWNNNAVCYYG